MLDFDGTLVTRDILDFLAQSVGKEKESVALNEAFHRGELPGLQALIQRINFLKGMTKTQMFAALKPESFLMPGAEELMSFFKKHGIVTILASGNIVPVLEYYQRLLGIDYVVGPQPQMQSETILGIDESVFSSKTFKLDGIRKILNQLSIEPENVIALGDSPSDKGMFELSNFAIAVNPKGDIAESANAVVEHDLNQVVQILEDLV